AGGPARPARSHREGPVRRSSGDATPTAVPKSSPRDRVAVSASANRVPHHPPAPPALCGASAVRLTRHMTFDGQQQHPLEGTHVLFTRDDDLVGARGVRLQKESELYRPYMEWQAGAPSPARVRHGGRDLPG